jgi:nitrite reductase (NO-forming)
VVDSAKSSAESAGIAPALKVQYERGRDVYGQTCFVCHQPNGQGVPGQIPPLAHSDLLMADRVGAIRGVIQGRSGEVTVNGKKYNGIMIPFPQLSDEQIADVLTYVRNSWGNSSDPIKTSEVGELRKAAPTLAANPFE